MKIEINLNEQVKVKLTSEGERILKEYFNEYPNNIRKATWLDEDGYYVTQLWDFMNIFGSKLYNGQRQLFVNNKLIFESKW
jgi:hypothetical protein